MSAGRVAYLLSAFPALSETFVLNEVVEQEALGAALEIYSLRYPGRKDLLNPRARPFRERVYYGGFFLAPKLLASLLGRLILQPAVMGRILALTLRHNLSAPLVLLKCLLVLPKAVHFANRMRASGITRLHCHFGTFPAYAAWVVGRLSGIPFSFTVHAHDIYDFQQMLKLKMDEALGVVVNSEYNRAFLKRFHPEYPGERLRLIRTGIYLDRFLKQVPHSASSPSERERRILAVGRVDPTKGYGDMIKVVAMLRQRGYQVVADVIGHVTQERYIRKEYTRLMDLLDELELREHFHFLEGLPFDVLQSYYDRADLFFLPCVVTESGNSDGLPSVLVEALAMGKPVVSTRISGIPELVRDGETGRIAEQHDLEAQAEACGELLDSPELAFRLAAAGQRLVREQWDIKVTARQMRTFLEQT